MLLLACSGCATVPREPPGPPPTRPTERSSLDAVLMHRTELQLTDAQEKQLRDLDDAREVRAQEATQELRARVERQRTAEKGDPPPSGGGGMRGGGRGGGMRGGGRSGGGLSGGPAGGGRGMRGPPAEMEAIETKLDDADTQAFFAAEAVLTPAQLELARKFASAYREALFNWRQALRNRPPQ